MIIFPGVGLDDPFIKKAVVEYANAVLRYRENRHGSKITVMFLSLCVVDFVTSQELLDKTHLLNPICLQLFDCL